MNKLILILPLFFLTMCGEAPVTPPAGACSLPLDGSPANCPDPDEVFVRLPREEMKGEIDVWNPQHFIQIEQMFIRNARRKQSGTLIWWFNEWAEKEKVSDKVQLLMHTDPSDPHGQDLDQIIRHLGLDENRQVLISKEKQILGSMHIVVVKIHFTLLVVSNYIGKLLIYVSMFQTG